MYENNYPNNYNNTSANTYQYGSSGSFSGVNGSDYHQSGNTEKNPKKKKSGSDFGRKIAIGICCGLCFGIFAGLGFQAVSLATDLLRTSFGIVQTDDSNAKVKETAVLPATDTESEEAVEDSTEEAESRTVLTTVTDVSDVVKEVMPAVVSVNNRYIEKMTFFGQEYSQEAGGSGSGIIVGQNDTELLLVTNYHVVASAEELTVQFVDGKQVQAQTKGTDEDKDLAVIAVQLGDIDADTMNQIKIAELGSSDDLTVGEPVIAIGNALGYGQSVTTGVVSALDRPIAVSSTQNTSQMDATEVNTFIQTDAAINPGNSGGALLNMRGEVIGINSNKIGGSAVEGIGYAIPISDAKPIIEELMNKQTRLKVGENNQGYLGITGVDVVDEYAQIYDAPKGVYVSKVIEGTGADQAGLVRGDIITALNGEKVTSMAELKEELSYYAVGTTVELTIMQGSPVGYQSKTVQVTLGSQSVTP
ncbi:MAG: trypsin-like peptidase domain-containing protein [Firmicutes bacterium]|nr:trypsin-like peptidase domain-containing protein [Bacillota bacterium]